MKRKRIIVGKLGAVKSPLYKILRIISPITTKIYHSTPCKHLDFKSLIWLSNEPLLANDNNDVRDLDDTFLYCDKIDTASLGIKYSEVGLLNNNSKEGSTMSWLGDDIEDQSNQELLTDAIEGLKEHNVDNEVVKFLKLVSQKDFPLDNVAFQLFLDVVKWFDTEDVRSIRHNDTSMTFFWLGKHLFSGRFIRFMGGSKNLL